MEVRSAMERVSTGIKDLDGLLDGGFPNGSVVLVCGGPGTGKTTLAVQFLLCELGKTEGRTVLVTLEESAAMIRKNMHSLDLDLESAEKNSTLLILDASMSRIGLPSSERTENILPGEFSVDELATRLFRLRPEPKKIALDCLSALEFGKASKEAVRRSIYKLFQLVRSLGCTAVFTSETYSGSSNISRFGVEEYLADGLVQLKIEDTNNELKRKLAIRKMRGTRHSLGWHEYKIGEGGIDIERG